MGRKVQTKDFQPERWARPSAEWYLFPTQVCRWVWKSWLLSWLSSYDGWWDSIFLVVLWVQSQYILSLFQSWGNSWFRLPALRPIEMSVSEVMVTGEGKRYIRLAESWVLDKEHKRYCFSRYRWAPQPCWGMDQVWRWQNHRWGSSRAEHGQWTQECSCCQSEVITRDWVRTYPSVSRGSVLNWGIRTSSGCEDRPVSSSTSRLTAGLETESPSLLIRRRLAPLGVLVYCSPWVSIPVTSSCSFCPCCWALVCNSFPVDFSFLLALARCRAMIK